VPVAKQGQNTPFALKQKKPKNDLRKLIFLHTIVEYLIFNILFLVKFYRN